MESSILEFYLQQGPRTRIDSILPDGFSREILDIVAHIQSKFIHANRVKREDIPSASENRIARDPQTVRDMLAKVEFFVSADIPLERKAVGICRNFSMVLASLLRAIGIPARARCGFGTYFGGGYFDDHWICEYWQASENRWKRVDSQIDEYWKAWLRLDPYVFNPLNIKRGQFFTGGEIWKLYREGWIDADMCGFSMDKDTGEYYIRGNLLRDFFALNKVEYTYQETSRLMERSIVMSSIDLKLLDDLADVTVTPDDNFLKIRNLFEEHPELKPVSN